ncbi:MAG: hypothetical protein NZ777_16470 [Pseudomonadales bacterium]|nr:hypothetical protein [Pseudomonadales bacterium]
MKTSVEESIREELWLIRISRRIGKNDGQAASYLALQSWIASCDNREVAIQVVDNALLSDLPVYKVKVALQIFANDYSLVMQRIKSNAIPDDKPVVVRKVKAKGQRAKRITGDGPRPETP